MLLLYSSEITELIIIIYNSIDCRNVAELTFIISPSPPHVLLAIVI